MGNPISATRLWSHCLLLASLRPLARALGVDWGWSDAVVVAGCASCLAAVASWNRMALILAGLAGIWGIAEPFLQSPRPDARVVVFSLIATSGLLVLVQHLTSRLRRVSDRLSQFESNHTEQLQTIHKSLSKSGALTASVDADSCHGMNSVTVTTDGDEPLDYATLLLSLQEIGRRISANLDFQSLNDSIIDIATRMLDCDAVDVFAWTGRHRTLQPLARLKLPDSRSRTSAIDSQTGMVGWVVRHQQLLTYASIEQDSNFPHEFIDRVDPPDAVAPLVTGEEFLGVLVLRGCDCTSMKSLHLLHVLATFSALALKNAHLFCRIENMARRDGLTGLFNHAAFYLQLRELLVETSLARRPLSLIMSDIDRFKNFNDAHGHQAGDQVLREVARVWNAVAPESAIVARYGGEEFVCALPDTDLESAAELAELLRSTMEQHHIDRYGQALNVTGSFGVATVSPDAASTEELIRRADEALYVAKAEGRNQVVVWSRSASTSSGEATDESTRPTDQPAQIGAAHANQH
ncbi:MAG: sensor domain-containing diguanylate cyclase [Planctomycetota bacterium]|nr:sensor domain-containing diguanylate cyclase [Planctomycetota bacterium]